MIFLTISKKIIEGIVVNVCVRDRGRSSKGGRCLVLFILVLMHLMLMLILVGQSQSPSLPSRKI